MKITAINPSLLPKKLVPSVKRRKLNTIRNTRTQIHPITGIIVDVTVMAISTGLGSIANSSKSPGIRGFCLRECFPAPIVDLGPDGSCCNPSIVPAITRYLIHVTGNRAMPGAWMSCAAALGLIAAILVRHTQSTRQQSGLQAVRT